MVFGKKNEGKTTKIFYATDLHGSDRTFMKFTNFVKICQADIVLIGGDLTGKAVIPIMENPGGAYYAYFQGRDCVARNQEELSELEKSINTNGMYSFRTSREEADALSVDEKRSSDLFMKLITERLEKWVKILEERLKPLGVRVYITGGNDDDPMVDDALRSSDYVVNPESMVIDVDEHHEMISTGYGNITPWRCPRDISEEQLAEKIDAMASKVKNVGSCIFNLHVPPIDSLLDQCPKLDTSVDPPKPILGETTGGGSVAVRRAIERYQPLIGLHGHIHESKGVDKIGKTLCFNPGSEYSEGVLRGVIINLTKDSVKSFQFISG